MRSDDDSSLADVEWLPVEPRRQNYRILSVALIVIGVFLALLTIVLFISVLARRINSLDREVEVTRFRTSAQLQRETAAAYRDYDVALGSLPGVGPDEVEERQAIEALLEEIKSCANSGDSEQFRELVDFDKHLKRVDLAGTLPNYSSIDRRYARGWLREYANVPDQWKELKVVKVLTARDDPTTRILYVFAKESSYDDFVQFRILIGWDGEQWKLYDWMRLDFGVWESIDSGVYLKYDGLTVIDGLNRWGELILEADQLISQYENDAAREKLKLAEAQRVPHEVEARCQLLTAYRWHNMNDREAVERCLSKIKDPSAAPGMYELLLLSYRWNNEEKAIRNAELSEAALGPNPSLLEIKASLYEQNGELEKAREAWEQLLTIEPDNLSALGELLLALPNERKSEITRYLQGLTEPSKTLANLAASMSWQDGAALEFLTKYTQQQFPESPMADYVSGLLQRHRGSYAQAADSYRRAMESETDEDSRSTYARAYLYVMISIGRGVEAFKLLPDQDSLFESLSYNYEEEDSELTVAEFREITEYYCQKFPNSLAGYDQLASLALEQRDFQETEKVVRKALSLQQPSTDPNDADENEGYLNSLHYKLAESLYRLDRLEQAYRVGDDQNARFAQLAHDAFAERDWKNLKTLLELRSKDEPEDPRLSKYEAELFVRDQEWERALALLERAKPKVEEYEKHEIEGRILQLHVANESWVSYYLSSDEQEEVFAQLARQFVNGKQWSKLERLAELHKDKLHEDAGAVRHLADAAWERSDYQEYIRHAGALLQVADEEEFSTYLQAVHRSQLLTAMIETERWNEARELALKRQREEGESDLLALLNAAQGKFSEAKSLVWNVAEENEDASMFYTNDILSDVFLGSEFENLREEYPVTLPYDYNRVSGLVMGDEPWILDAESIAAATGREEISSAEVIRVPSARENVADAFLVRLDGATVWIAAGSGPFFQKLDFTGTSNPLLAEAGQSNYWLVSGAAVMSDLTRRDAVASARQVLRRLGGGAKLLFAPQHDSWGAPLIYPASQELLSQWASTGSVPLALGQGLPVYPWQQRQDVSCDREFEMSLREAVQSFESGSNTQLKVMGYLVPQVKLGLLQLRVESVKRKYGSLQFVGTLTNVDDSVSEFPQGLRMQFDLYQLCSWQIDDEPVVFRQDCQ